MDRARFALGRPPRVAIALGGGGARGIAHVLALEALDELGVRPSAIAGASIGAVLGGAYGAGLEAREIRMHVLRVLRKRSDVVSKLLRARVGRFADFVLRRQANPVLLDPEMLLGLFWPSDMPSHFEDLLIKTNVVATDYATRSEVVFDTGLLSPAVAGSMAIPGIFRPVEFGNRVLLDGGAVNPLPYDLLFDQAEIVVAVDVTFGGRSRSRQVPKPLESMFAAAQIMQGAITEQKLKRRRPHILVRPKVEMFGVLDFLRAGQILRAAESTKDELKFALEAQMNSPRRA